MGHSTSKAQLRTALERHRFTESLLPASPFRLLVGFSPSADRGRRHLNAKSRNTQRIRDLEHAARAPNRGVPVSSATNLSNWIRANLEYRREPLTHLKLQKLAFYCYGGALAFGLHDVGAIRFEAWDHGPVSPDIYAVFRGTGRAEISFLDDDDAPTYAQSTAERLRDVLGVYGALDAWSLRQESHRERPWIDAYHRNKGVISTESITDHFAKKFARGPVRAPEQLLFASSFSLDGIPLQGFGTLHDLANAVRSSVPR